MSSLTTDLLIVGGGPAGLTCALVFARLARPAILYDSGLYRNAQSKEAHTIPGYDGKSPADWRRDVVAEIQASYPWVTIRRGQIDKIHKSESGIFEASAADGASLRARKVVLATGIQDNLPDVPGVAKIWGTKALHCIFCHGTETRFSPLAFLLDAKKPRFNSMVVASSLSLWPSLRHPATYYLTDGLDIADEGQLVKSGLQSELRVIKANGSIIITEKISRIEDTSDGLLVHFENHREPLAVGHVAVMPNSWSPNPHSRAFLDEALLSRPLSPDGSIVPAESKDLEGRGTLPPLMGDEPRTATRGLFWAGNSGSFMGNVINAISQGQMSAVMAGKELGDEDLAQARQ
ncbi:FAD/NAD(P)-binding domain-containing protein [Microstroma glucosiphilum]|uniref:FAD/NAD(P)-binding domain-containing protein n=1 Tax=Pseudomicrostroma glucosiphilum TaxID=1684307 RepID=A0A316U1H8_9BASI|nr:FAD/NAD(P)-binding domain-containing protein [Pseudomicrostroma glucosiphilum]PWN18704.1 FAD/NAD(P)-binding domain-containing protein [Pseudomicrostroma glucosiphilum]